MLKGPRGEPEERTRVRSNATRIKRRKRTHMKIFKGIDMNERSLRKSMVGADRGMR